MAEKVHRIRRRRAYLRDENTPQPFGFIDILRRLKAEGASADEVERVIDTICIEPVFTAHPTEVTRRTLLRKQQSIARHLVEMMDPYMTPQELEATLGQIRMEMTTGWQTSEYPMEGIRLRDEAEHVLFFLLRALSDASAVLRKFRRRVDGHVPRIWWAHTRSAVLRFCSWVGGDMDSNPNVTAKSIRETLGRQRALVLDLYYQECQELARHLSQDLSRIGVSEELMQQSRLYAGHFPEAANSVPARHRQMPYRSLPAARRRPSPGNVRRCGVSLRVPDGVHRRYRAHRSELARAKRHSCGIVPRAAVATPRANVRLRHRDARH